MFNCPQMNWIDCNEKRSNFSFLIIHPNCSSRWCMISARMGCFWVVNLRCDSMQSSMYEGKFIPRLCRKAWIRLVVLVKGHRDTGNIILSGWIGIWRYAPCRSSDTKQSSSCRFKHIWACGNGRSSNSSSICHLQTIDILSGMGSTAGTLQGADDARGNNAGAVNKGGAMTRGRRRHSTRCR